MVIVRFKRTKMTLFGAIQNEKPANNGETHFIFCYNKISMGNTVGSTHANFCIFNDSAEDAYILGLWCADGYWWSSSFGLSNTNNKLLSRFRNFFLKHFKAERIKFNDNHLFVNSRPLLREFRSARDNILSLKNKLVLSAYFAGRFDGDGSVSKDLRSDCRIVYSNEKEVKIDRVLIKRIGITKTRIYYYESAKTFCLYISRFQAKEFLDKILPYSVKMQKLACVTP